MAMNEHITSKPRRFGAKFFVTIVLILLAAGAGAGVTWFLTALKPERESSNENRQMQLSLTGSDMPETTTKLADKFTDADGELIADAPTDPQQLIDPPKLSFSYVAQEEPEK